MLYQLLLVALCATIVAHGKELPEPDADELEGYQGDEEMLKFEVLAEFMKRTFFPQEQSRDDECLPEGSECYFWGGPNCCGIDLRCHYWGYQGPASRRGGGANWQSICKKWRGGVWLKAIGDWFSSLG